MIEYFANFKVYLKKKKAQRKICKCKINKFGKIKHKLKKKLT